MHLRFQIKIKIIGKYLQIKFAQLDLIKFVKLVSVKFEVTLAYGSPNKNACAADKQSSNKR